MKKSLTIILSIIFVLSITVTSFAATNITPKAGEKKDKQKLAISKIDKTFTKYYEKFEGNMDKALEAICKDIPSLSVVSRAKSIYKIENGKAKHIMTIENGKIIYSEEIGTLSTSASIAFDDSLVWDNDWNTYVYFGEWDWDPGQPDEENLQPWDCIGFYTTRPDTAEADEYIVRGYNGSGVREIYYNTDSHESEGDISKGTQTIYGVAFWHDESPVEYGTITVPLRLYSSSYTARVMTKFGHSWTETNITGIGGEASIDGAGFSIQWDTNVLHWPDVATSYGVDVP